MSTTTPITLDDLEVIPDLPEALALRQIPESTSDHPSVLYVISHINGSLIEFRFVKVVAWHGDGDCSIRIKQQPLGNFRTIKVSDFLEVFGKAHVRPS